MSHMPRYFINKHLALSMDLAESGISAVITMFKLFVMLRGAFSFSADRVTESWTNKPGKEAAKYVKKQLLSAVN